MRCSRALPTIFGSSLLSLLFCLTAVVAPAAHADQQRLDKNTVQVTSDLRVINHSQTIADVVYDCPSGFPLWRGDWSNISTGTQSTLIGPIGVSAVLDPFAALASVLIGQKLYFTFTNWALTGDQRYGVSYTCQRHPTIADCGGEDQPVCWGAVKSDGGAADDMFEVLGALNCDRGLVIDVKNFLGDKNTCKDSTRHMLHGEADGGSRVTRVLDEQAYQLGADEPMNLVVRPGTHESYNDRNDNYTFPNQKYSLSDQLDAGVRYLDLRARNAVPVTPYMRMSHGTNTCGGCSATDRPLNYGIEEVGRWLANNPQQVIAFRIGQYSDTETTSDRDYVIDPIAKYLGNRVLGPTEWCQYLVNHAPVAILGNDGPAELGPSSCQSTVGQSSDTYWSPYRWPTLAEMRNPANWTCNCVKQAIIAISGSASFQDGKWLFDLSFDTDATGTAAARNFDASTCSRGGVSYLGLKKADYFRSWATETEARVFGQAVYAHEVPDSDPWPGYIYARHSDIPTSPGASPTEATSLQSPRPYANEGTSIEDLLNCNLGATVDMYMADQFYNGDAKQMPTTSLRREAMVWTWQTDEDTLGGKCALLGRSDSAFHAHDCAERHPVACAPSSTMTNAVFRFGDPWSWQDPLGAQWYVTNQQYTFAGAQQGCQTEYPGTVFGVPTNKYMANQLQKSNLRGSDVWLAYSNNVSGDGPEWKKWRIARTPTIALPSSFPVARGGSVTLKASSSGLPVDKLSAVWQWQVNGQSVAISGATAQFSAIGIPAGSTVPVQVTVTDATGLTSSASSVVYVTPAGFTPLEARAFNYPARSTDAAFIHGANGHTMSVAASGSGTLTLGRLGYANTPRPSAVSPNSTFYSASVSANSAFNSLAFTLCEPGFNLAFAYDSLKATWGPVPGQKFDTTSGCVKFTASTLSALHIDQLNALVFAFVRDTTPPWNKLFMKTADHVAYFPGTVATQDVELIFLADDASGSGVAGVAYTVTALDDVGAPSYSATQPANTTFWLTHDGHYNVSYSAVDYAGNASPVQTVTNIIIKK